MLRASDWAGDWFQDCQHKDIGGHYVASLGENGFPMATMFYNGAQTGKGRLVNASVADDGKLVTVTESQIEEYLTSRATVVEVSRDNSFQVLSFEADLEAIADVPRHSFTLTPDGMTRGSHLHAWVVRNSMILDSSENPLRPTTTYYRCGEGVS